MGPCLTLWLRRAVQLHACTVCAVPCAVCAAPALASARRSQSLSHLHGAHNGRSVVGLAVAAAGAGCGWAGQGGRGGGAGEGGGGRGPGRRGPVAVQRLRARSSTSQSHLSTSVTACHVQGPDLRHKPLAIEVICLHVGRHGRTAKLGEVGGARLCQWAREIDATGEGSRAGSTCSMRPAPPEGATEGGGAQPNMRQAGCCC